MMTFNSTLFEDSRLALGCFVLTKPCVAFPDIRPLFASFE